MSTRSGTVHSAPIHPAWWLGITGVGAVVFAIVEAEKWLRRLAQRRSAARATTD